MVMKRILRFIVIFIIAGLAITHFYTNTQSAKGGKPITLDDTGCLGLNYHRVYDDTFTNKAIEWLTHSQELTDYNVYKSEFKEQIDYLIEHDAQFLTEEQVVKTLQTGSTFPDRCVWISFDDIEQSVYTNAFPILKEHAIPFSIYVLTAQVGKNYQNLQMASWEQLQKMQQSGLVEVGVHTHNLHYLEDNKAVFLQPTMQQSFLHDLRQSKKEIYEQLGTVPKHFAYPFGTGSSELAAILEKENMTAAILVPQTIKEHDSPMWINRLMITTEGFGEITSWFQ